VFPQNTSGEIDHLTKTFRGPSRINANGEVTDWAQYPLEPALPIKEKALIAMQRSEIIVPDFEQYLNMHPEYRGWNPETDHPGWKPEYQMMASLSKAHKGKARKGKTRKGKARKGKARAVDKEDNKMTPSSSTKGNNPTKADIPQVRGQNNSSAVRHRNMKRPTSERAKELQTSGANHNDPSLPSKDMRYESNDNTMNDAFGIGSVPALSVSPSQGNSESSSAAGTGNGSLSTDWMQNLWTHPRTGRINGHWYQLPVSTLVWLNFVPNPSTEPVVDPAFLPPMNYGDWVQFQSSQIVVLDGIHWILPAACPVQFVSLASMEDFAPWSPPF